jgi:hypothetical protein
MAIAALQAPDFARLDKIREAKAELDAEAKNQGGGLLVQAQCISQRGAFF